MNTRKEEIEHNLVQVREKIQKSARASNRDLGEIELIAVTKTFPATDVAIPILPAILFIALEIPAASDFT